MADEPPSGASAAEIDTYYESILSQTEGTVDDATAVAKTQARRIERSKKTVELTMLGNASLVAGAHVTLDGFRAGIAGKYKIVTVRHSLSRSGWTTSITGEAL